MIQSTTADIEIPAAEQVYVVDPQPAETNILTFLTAAYLSRRLGHMYSQAAIPRGLVTPLRRLWGHYYPRLAYGEEGVIMPRSTLGFIVNGLLAFIEIKSQSQHGFPFQTHPRPIMLAVISLLVYGLASAAELVIPTARGVDGSSIYATIAHLGKIGSLCILVASLASLFYF